MAPFGPSLSVGLPVLGSDEPSLAASRFPETEHSGGAGNVGPEQHADAVVVERDGAIGIEIINGTQWDPTWDLWDEAWRESEQFG